MLLLILRNTGKEMKQINLNNISSSNLKTEFLRNIESGLINTGILKKNKIKLFRKVNAEHILKTLEFYESLNPTIAINLGNKTILLNKR